MRSSSVRTPKFQLTTEQPSTGECCIPPRKIFHIQGQRRSPNKMVGGAKSHLESNPIPARDAQRAQTKPHVHRDPGIPQETEPDPPLSFWVSPVEAQVSSGLPWGRGLWLPQTWEVWLMSPTIEPPSRQSGEQLHQRSFRTVLKVLGCTTDFPTWGSSKETENPQGIWLWRTVGLDYRTSTGRGGNRLLEGTKRCVHQDPGKRSSDPTRDWARLACECPGISGRDMGEQWPAVGSRASIQQSF